ncbi:MAG: TVP38/TMEM64 family protein [Coriobacteriia bacterium]|nr:TVP38/TMEM64 family protein [Coriobacteriia bacterium]
MARDERQRLDQPGEYDEAAAGQTSRIMRKMKHTGTDEQPKHYNYDAVGISAGRYDVGENQRRTVSEHLASSGEHDFDPVSNKAMRDEGHAQDHGEKVFKIGKREFAASDLIKLIGLVAFFGVVILIVVLAWPTIHDIFEEGGLDLLIQRMHEAGPLGVLILLGLQLLQVIVAFIPGEVVQVAAGMLYGPIGGTLVILLGVVIASSLVFQLVHVLGAPFVRSMVSDASLEKFRSFEKSGKLNVVVFILFLIPGLPKDVFTYIVGLTDMKLGTFLLLSTLGRTPGVFVSSYAASSIMEGDFTTSAIMFGVLAVLAALGVIFRDKIMDRFAK